MMRPWLAAMVCAGAALPAAASFACYLSNATNWAGVRAPNVTSGCLPWVDACGDPPVAGARTRTVATGALKGGQAFLSRVCRRTGSHSYGACVRAGRLIATMPPPLVPGRALAVAMVGDQARSTKTTPLGATPALHRTTAGRSRAFAVLSRAARRAPSPQPPEPLHSFFGGVLAPCLRCCVARCPFRSRWR